MHPEKFPLTPSWLARLFLLIAVLSGLAGCAATPQERAALSPAAIVLPPSQGLVVLKLTSNVVNSYGTWSHITFRNVETKMQWVCRNSGDFAAAHSVFVGALPAGTYDVVQVDSVASGVMTFIGTAKAEGRFPTFTVKPGQMTDLGTLAYLQRLNRNQSREYQWGIAPRYDIDRPSVWRQLSPTLAAQLQSAPVLGWDEGDLYAQRRRTFDALRTMTLNAKPAVRREDGATLMGEAFGQVAVRTAQGQWSMIQTPMSLAVRALHVRPDGLMVVGSDDGIALLSRDRGVTWQPLDLPVKDGTVLYAGQLKGRDDLMLVLQTRDQFVGYSIRADGQGAWKTEFAEARGLIKNPIFDEVGHVIALESGPLLVSGSGEVRQRTVRYDAASAAWTMTKNGDYSTPLFYFGIGHETVGSFAGTPMLGMYVRVSRDHMRTWERRGKIGTPDHGSVAFASDKVGYFTQMDSRPVFDNEAFGLSIQRTLDGGMSWETMGSPGSVPGRLIVLGSDNQLGFAAANGKFRVSKDGGKTWTTEVEMP